MKSQPHKSFNEKEIEELLHQRQMVLANVLFNLPFQHQEITVWEDLDCVGFNPETSKLEAIVSIKRSTGYSGNLCTNGSTEYVRFFVDYGSGFVDAGFTSFQAHDISDLPPGQQHPLKYMVQLLINDAPFRKYNCKKAVTPLVRAVLSWNHLPPSDPTWIPFYGMVRDARIQLKNNKLSLRIFLEELALKKLPEAFAQIDLDKEVIFKTKEAKIPTLLEKYRKDKVSETRFLYPVLQPLTIQSTGIALAASLNTVYDFKSLGIDISTVLKDLTIAAKADTSFEELVCVGLNTSNDTLGAVIKIKKTSGYSGDLCHTGSLEYVAFWADWDNNNSFDQYLGTAAVQVHDIDNIPAEGLFYNVSFPINLNDRIKSCKKPNIIKIRAVLSWSTPPSTTNPNTLNYYGNRLDALVQIRTSQYAGADLLIYDISYVPIPNIDAFTALAYPSLVSPSTYKPFGGYIRIGGGFKNSFASGTFRYKIQYFEGGDWNDVTGEQVFVMEHFNDPFNPLHTTALTDTNGWYEYLGSQNPADFRVEYTNQLGIWDSGSKNGLYKLRVLYTTSLAPIPDPSSVLTSQEISIMLDNINYSASPTPNSSIDFSHTLDLIIDGLDCQRYVKGTPITGHLRAIDKYFGSWSLEIQPSNRVHFPGGPPLLIETQSSRNVASLADNGDADHTWTLYTQYLDPCGYTLRLSATDRSIVGYNKNPFLTTSHYSEKYVGFTVDPA